MHILKEYLFKIYLNLFFPTIRLDQLEFIHSSEIATWVLVCWANFDMLMTCFIVIKFLETPSTEELPASDSNLHYLCTYVNICIYIFWYISVYLGPYICMCICVYIV